MKPQEPIPHNYRMATLNRIFAFASLALLLTIGVMVIYDYISGWKRFQMGFLRLEQQRITQELHAAEQSENRAQLRKLDEEMREREVEIARNRDRFRSAQEELDDWEGRHYAADQNYRFAKATLDAMRYEAEIAAQKKESDAASKQKRYEAQSDHVAALKLRLEDVTRRRDAAQARVDVWQGKVSELEDQKKEALATIDRLQKQLETVEPTPQFVILNAPLLDFINPTLKIDQIVVNDMFVDLNYLRVPRVDRCTTCHRAIDRPGFESKKEAARLEAELEKKLENFQIQPERVGETRSRIEQLKRIQTLRGIPNPYRTHPQLDVFVGSASPHPMSEYGCTVCHRGLDRATNFARAGHSPMSRKQQRRWESSWRWEDQPYLETPMRPRQYFEAACIKCHSSQITVAGGPRITRGMQMVELYGCYACHNIKTWRFTDLRKPGPDLNGIAEKTTPAWAVRWISDPHVFRSTTRMPSFFYQRNMIGPAVPASERDHNIRLQNAEIHALVTYLFGHSTRRQWQPPGAAGDPKRGQALVSSIGCMGCHVAQDTVQDATGGTRPARRDDFPLERNYGFNLVGVGTKTNPAWLYNWLKNPRNYYSTAPMPDLRLSDQEAADITAYLMTLQKPQFMARPVPPLDRAAVAELTKSYLVNTMTEREARAKLLSMTLNSQLDYLGQRTIEKYGCYSCHNIKGFEGLKPIGTELTTEGSKALHLFDFGFVHRYDAEDGKKERIDHTVPSWVFNKLRSPRVWDDEREKSYGDKLKMPNFHFSRAEAEAITSVVLGLTKDKVEDSRLARMDPRSRAVEEGRKLISQHNCRGCHVVEGYGRAIASTIADPGFLPPDLTPEGGRVQSAWLFQFLKDPTVMRMRPWLSVRMPTFHFSDEEANTLVQSFAADGKVLQFDNARYAESDAKSAAIGKTVFEMLKCAKCHPSGPVAASPQTDTASLAPNLSFARVRLQHEWIPDWIRRPNEIIPGTRMPTNFPRDQKTGDFVSPLVLALDSPAFAPYKARLAPYYANDAEMKKALGDAVAITTYLRDYIWTLGPAEMRLNVQTPEGRKIVPAPPAPSRELPAAKTSGAAKRAGDRPAR